jgi:crotonobetainyl-CoA:carnitine CoA-transferase CaiB-like acyl-CoA transferase
MTRPFTKRRTAGVIAAAMLALGGIATTAGAKSIDPAPVGSSVAGPPSGVIAVIALLIAAGNLTIRRRSQPEHT